MKTIQSVSEMQGLVNRVRAEGKRIALVPTMGCLHEGHCSLIRTAKAKAEFVVVSIFVNPTQFGPNEDFDRYPRQLEDDLLQCESLGVDAVFNPSLEEMYPRGYSTYVSEEVVGSGLCGVSRPAHFRGVTTICLKLFHIVQPHLAVFGQKDAQQAAVLKKMVRDLNLQLEMEIAPTLRDLDGLAMSSRNKHLSNSQRADAISLSRALAIGKKMVEDGVRNVDRVVAEITHHLAQHRRVRVIYVQIVDRETMEPAREIVPGRHLIAIAAWVDEVRLIDNMVL
jgi:pantoate--beta-alanine ligase